MPQNSMAPDRAQLAGISGAILLFVGAIAPLVSVPVLGSVSLLRADGLKGGLMVVLAIAALLLTLARQYRLVWLPGTAALGLTGFIYLRLADFLEKMHSALGIIGNLPFLHGISDLLMRSVHLEWGWAALVLGGVLTLASTALGATVARPRVDVRPVENRSPV